MCDECIKEIAKLAVYTIRESVGWSWERGCVSPYGFTDADDYRNYALFP